MKLFKIQASSIGISRSNDQKTINHKKSLCKTRKKGPADIISKKLDIDLHQAGGILVQPIDNPLVQNKQWNKLIAKRQNTLVLNDQLTNHNQEPIVKSNFKLPLINNPAKLNKKQSIKNDIDQIITEGGQNLTRQNSSTQHKNRPSLSKISINNQVQGSDSKGEPFLKMMKIQSMKPIQKNHLSKNDLTFSQPDFQREKRAALERIRRKTRNQTQKSLLRHQPDLQTAPIKNRTQTKIVIQKKSQSVEKTLGKDRKTTSFIKSNPVTAKKKSAVSYYDFCLFISLLNKMDRPNQPNATYKAYVGKGNNSILVKNTLKNRFWWNIIDNDNQVNFVWSQHRENKFISNIKSYQSENPQIIKKKTQFYLQINKQNNDRSDVYRNHTKVGLGKLLGDQQYKKFNTNPYSSEIPSGSYRVTQNPNKSKLHNHLQFNWHLCNKKALYYNMKSYYKALKQNPFEYIPLTFHIKGEGDQQWQLFEKYFMERQQEKKTDEKGKKKKQKNLWIIKPGENSNQGCGIDVSDDIEEIKTIIKGKSIRPNGKVRSHIIQKYLMPFLYNKRKFDIRCYVLVTSVNSIIKAYWYEEGYIRTSSKDFTTKNLKNKFIHLTNDAVQKKAQQYGKFQNGNKVSFQDFQKYVDTNYPDRNLNFFNTVYPKMMKLAADTVKSTQFLLDANKRQFSFEIFGLDFMIDQDFNTWLIEVNNNPCLQLGSPLLARIIPNMIENAFRIAVDPLFPPPKQFPKTKTLPTQLFQFNKFTLIFNSSQESQSLNNILKAVNLEGIVESDEQQDTFSDANEQICGQI